MKRKYKNKYKMNEEEIKAAFDSFDKSQDGLISFKEYVDGCRKNGSNFFCLFFKYFKFL